MSFYLKLADLISRLSYSNLGLKNMLKQQHASELALMEREESLMQIIHTIPDPLTIIKADSGICIEANDKLTILTGYSREEIIGKTAKDLDLWAVPEDRNKLVQGIQAAGFIDDLEATFKRKDGSTFTGILSAKLMTHRGEKCIITVTKDITHRKSIELALAESEAKYRYLYDNALVAMFTTTLQGKPVDANETTLKMLGYSTKEEFFTHFQATDHWVFPVQRSNLVRQVRENGVVHGFQALARRKDGTEFYAEFSAKLNPDKLTLDVVSLDISTRKKAELELIESKERAEESDRLKSAFLANMSHEIRTPMNGIMGFTELLKEPGLTGEEQKRFIEIIQRSGNRLLDTVNDLIDISRIETGQMPVVYNETNVNWQLENLFCFFKSQTEQKGVKLLFDPVLPAKDANLLTDQTKPDSILTNLIKNAVKYTETGEICFGCTANEKFLEFFVKDTGIGIPENRREAIFNRFEQADITDKRALQWSGLGLTIAKAYVEMLGGAISVESKEGKGSTFRFTILKRSVVNQKQKKPEPSVEGWKDSMKTKKRFNILIAEDDEMSYLYIVNVLADLDCEIFRSTTGAETVEFCRNHPDVDLILMDVKMPLMNGYEATRQIREMNHKVVIVAQTAYALTGDKEKAMAAGCDNYVAKPIAKSVLRSMISRHIPNE
jgi:PAS domain S-box-containing protein